MYLWYMVESDAKNISLNYTNKEIWNGDSL